jgi:type II secretory ATPase GspE/PulE/Tfp pilus assembly ATPase PilB-like protein
LPSTYRAALLSRVKIMANLDISERRAQDGKICSRISAPPSSSCGSRRSTTDGLEDAVLRVLPGGGAAPMDQLGLRRRCSRRCRGRQRPYGILLSSAARPVRQGGDAALGAGPSTRRT